MWLHELRERLLRAGVAPRNVRRYLTELARTLGGSDRRRGARRTESGRGSRLGANSARRGG